MAHFVIQDLTFSYPNRERPALDHLDLTIEQGAYVVLCGASGSGKTTLIENLIRTFSGSVTLLSHDNYYRRHDELTYEERCKLNYDEPAALETDLMSRHLDELRHGNAIDCPIYDFTQHNRSADTMRIIPRQVIIVEGILIFENKELRDLMDIKIFVDADDDDRLMRVMARDIVERGKTVEWVIERYSKTVKPMYLQFIEPSKRYADIIIPQGGHNKVAIDVISATIEKSLNSNKK